MAAPLDVRSLSVGHGRQPVISEVDLRVEAGEVVGIVGHSGAGKSTLLHTLCGLLPALGGSVWVDGQDLTAASGSQRDRMRREKFGFVLQGGELVPEFSILENVGLPLRLLGASPAAASSAASEMLRGLGIDHLASSSVLEVSGGELQRAAIGRALVHEPTIVLADEPTGSLDEENAHRAFDLLVAQARGRGSALVVVTHEGWVAEQVDRCLRIEGGRARPR